jgi:hypothetical protein
LSLHAKASHTHRMDGLRALLNCRPCFRLSAPVGTRLADTRTARLQALRLHQLGHRGAPLRLLSTRRRLSLWRQPGCGCLLLLLLRNRRRLRGACLPLLLLVGLLLLQLNGRRTSGLQCRALLNLLLLLVAAARRQINVHWGSTPSTCPNLSFPVWQLSVRRRSSIIAASRIVLLLRLGCRQPSRLTQQRSHGVVIGICAGAAGG